MRTYTKRKNHRRYRVWFRPTPESDVTTVIVERTTNKATAGAAVILEYPEAEVGWIQLAAK